MRTVPFSDKSICITAALAFAHTHSTLRHTHWHNDPYSTQFHQALSSTLRLSAD
jgi:hypothetical protein